MLAYVFWHWRDRGVGQAEYRDRIIAFQRVLNDRGASGLRESMVLQIASVPWVNVSEEVYEEWYVLDGAAALDTLNHAAVSGSRQQPHNEVAQRAAGGTAALYTLHTGKPLHTGIQYALWFAKPSGMRYADFFARLTPQVENSAGCLWQRYMTLGPSPEFCWQSEDAQMLDAEFSPVALPVRHVLAFNQKSNIPPL